MDQLQQQVLEWLQHPVTKMFRDHLKVVREDLKESWASGAFSEDTEFKNAVKQAWAVGQCKLLDELLDPEALTSAINQETAANGE